MALLLDDPAGLTAPRATPLAVRAIRHSLLAIGPIDRVLAIVDGASEDLDGVDSAGQLARLVSLAGWGALHRDSLEVDGLRHVTPADLAAARRCGGALRPVVFAARDDSGVQAFVGPAFLSSSQPLAGLQGGLQGIHIAGTDVSTLFLSGQDLGFDTGDPKKGLPIVTTSPVTAWFARISFPGVVPPSGACANLIGAMGISVEGIADYAFGNARWLRIGSHSRAELTAAAQRLRAMHRIDAVMFRRITNLSSA